MQNVFLDNDGEQNSLFNQIQLIICLRYICFIIKGSRKTYTCLMKEERVV